MHLKKRRDLPLKYTPRKAKRTLRAGCALYEKKKISSSEEEALGKALLSLETALERGERSTIQEAAHAVDFFLEKGRPPKWRILLKETAWAVIFAFAIIAGVRQMCFEPMEIPSGSMRPTYREGDRLIVSKSSYGINIPLKPRQFYFDPKLLERTTAFIFTSEKMPIQDQDTRIFGVPAKKRLIKRCMGKPGDTLYFYGGQLYGMDAEGTPLSVYQEAPWLDKLEFIPFLRFEGEVEHQESVRGHCLTYQQMHQPLARLRMCPSGALAREIRVGNRWQPEEVLSREGSALKKYSDFYGMGHFAMVRLLKAEEARHLRPEALQGVEESDFYLELRHHPRLPRVEELQQGHSPYKLKTSTSLIPLHQTHLERLQHALYTARFKVEKGYASLVRAGDAEKAYRHLRPHLKGVPDGCYEFYEGTPYKVGFLGHLSPLPPDHPLCQCDADLLHGFFNMGMEMKTLFAPTSPIKGGEPARYAYYRAGELYLMGASIFQREDPLLVAFVDREEKYAQAHSDYSPFIDRGPPLLPDGRLDRELLARCGLHIPPGMYLGLGDNHAGSSDSRVFGFVPQENIRGTPAFLLSPFGSRWGWTKDPSVPLFTLPHLVVWGVILASASLYLLRRRNQARRMRTLLTQLKSIPEKESTPLNREAQTQAAT